MKERKNHGITLIALIITVIIMLILAGIVISQLTGENGLITKSSQVKARTEYEMAKEEVNTKLMEIVADCEERGVEYNIDEIVEAIKNDDEKTIELIYGTKTSAIDDRVNEEEYLTVSDIVVSVKRYSKYKFLVGEAGEIEGATTEEITGITDKTAFQSVDVFEADLLGVTLANGRETITNEEELTNKIKDTVITNYQSENGTISIPTTTRTTFKEFTNLSQGIYLVSYTQTLTLGTTGNAGIMLNDVQMACSACPASNGGSPILNSVAIINITNASDKITLFYHSNKATNTKDRGYQWQIIKLK